MNQIVLLGISYAVLFSLLVSVNFFTKLSLKIKIILIFSVLFFCKFCILSLISGRDLYTSEILEALKNGKMLVVEGTVYPLLTRLKNANLLQYRWEESTSGPPRKYYFITAEGEAFLTELQTVWKELNQAVKMIITKK